MLPFQNFWWNQCTIFHKTFTENILRNTVKDEICERCDVIETFEKQVKYVKYVLCWRKTRPCEIKCDIWYILCKIFTENICLKWIFHTFNTHHIFAKLFNNSKIVHNFVQHKFTDGKENSILWNKMKYIWYILCKIFTENIYMTWIFHTSHTHRIFAKLFNNRNIVHNIVQHQFTDGLAVTPLGLCETVTPRGPGRVRIFRQAFCQWPAAAVAGQKPCRTAFCYRQQNSGVPVIVMVTLPPCSYPGRPYLSHSHSHCDGHGVCVTRTRRGRWKSLALCDAKSHFNWTSGILAQI